MAAVIQMFNLIEIKTISRCQNLKLLRFSRHFFQAFQDQHEIKCFLQFKYTAGYQAQLNLKVDSFLY